MIQPSLILRVTQRWLVPLLVLVSLWLLIRGHDEPGGGFAGGLLAAAAVILVSLAEGPAAGRQLLRLAPMSHIALGLAIATASGLLGLMTGGAFLSARWLTLDCGLFVFKAGTPLIFDIGVYLLVLGVVSSFALEIEEAEPLADAAIESAGRGGDPSTS